jgi:hypothetical protein
MHIMCTVYIHYDIYISIYIYIYTVCIQYIYIYIYIYYTWLATVQPMRHNIIAINNVGTDTDKKHKHRKLGASR